METAVNKKFKDALITGILSSPIVYVPHFHYNYVDEALRDIIPETNIKDSVLGLCRDQVFELSNCDGKVDFKGKYLSSKNRIQFVALLKRLVISDGSVPIKGKEPFTGYNSPGPQTNEFAVDEKNVFSKERIFIVKNAAELLADPKIQYWLQIFASKYEKGDYDREMTLILVSPKPVSSLPSEIEKYISVVELPAPTEEEIERLINNEMPISKQFEHQKQELLVGLARAMMGLQLYEVEQIIRSIKVRTGGHLTEKALQYALEEKKSIVKKSGIIEVVDTDVSFDQVGGLEALRKDLDQKAVVFKHLKDIQDYRFPMPKGVLILGMPGCGKSLIAKSIANKFGVSLLRLDVNRLMGQYVGQSEENLRKALMTAEAAHPCVLWIDEIEKAFAGVNSSNSSNDIIMRLMGHFLTWMQERKTPVYIVATANDALRPELMRKGRFDEVYFVDFPNKAERVDILKKKIDNFRRTDDQQKLFDFSHFDNGSLLGDIADLMIGGDIEVKDDRGKPKKVKNEKGFSGAEIEAVVNAVMEKKYVDYFRQKDEAAKKTNNGKGSSVTILGKLEIKKEDFEVEIKAMQPSVMCNQKGGEDEKGNPIKTPIERIRDLQSVYKFKLATEEEK